MRFLILLCTFALSLLSLAGSAHAARNIVVMGDSLSAGYGIRPEQAWPALLDKRLAAQRFDYSVVNLSISGETSAGGRARLDAALREHHPALVVIALGANDGLRGLPLTQMRDNLDTMLQASRKAGAKVLLVGMQLPPNYGPYASQFKAVFQDLAEQRKAPLLPFLLEPVARQPRLFQPDNLHPVAEAQPLILDHLWPALTPLLK